MRGKRGNRAQLLLMTTCAGWLGAVGMSQVVFAANLPDVRLSPRNIVPACVTPQRLTAFLRSRNPQLDPRFGKISQFYAGYGEKLGVRWDIGFFQMMVETANLTFRRPDGTPGDVAPEHNNFAGIGAVGDGRPGETFISISHGVRAHLEHVLHYAGAAVPAPIAERTRKVQAWQVLAEWHAGFDRPITYTDLARRWAPHTDAYLASIELLATIYQRRYCNNRPLLLVERSGPRPAIAKTAWQFAKLPGRPGAAGTRPPTGRPNLNVNRGSLGVGARTPRPSPVTVAPPPVKRQERAVAAARPRANAMRHAAPTPPSRSKPPPRQRRISPDDRIRQLVSDRKVLLRTHVGVVVPIVYEANGEMTGQAGSLSFFLGASRDKGRWWVKNGKLCQKWRVWLDRDVHCIRLTKRRGTIWWHADDGKQGTARIVAK